MTRQPAYAGQFYPADKDALSDEVDKLIPKGTEKVNALGAIIPHAGYIYSGPVAGNTYARLEPKDTYIIFGPNHTGYGSRFASSNESWDTPFGTVNINQTLLDAIKQGTSLIKDDVTAHAAEHSIEVQLPFIEKIAPSSDIVPVTVKYGGVDELYEIAEAISNAIKGSEEDVMVIASSDMTHYESRENAQKKDDMAIQKIISLDPEGLFDVVEKNDISMCGYIPSVIMLMCACKLDAKKADLVKYSDSGYTTGDTDQVVGYAGIVVY